MARTYEVYGIGNALVDIQYRVEPEFLERMGIETCFDRRPLQVDEEREPNNARPLLLFTLPLVQLICFHP